MATGESLRGSAVRVRELQAVLHAKAKEEPDRRFHALVDKVWRRDFLLEAWVLVRRNGGAAGVDGVSVADVETYGVERWVGELSAATGYAIRRLRRWFCRKHKVRSGGYVRFPDQRLWKHHGLTRLGLTTKYRPWAKA